jgi:prepilin-type N-terminal cleavage/methylation domain-containing protein
MKRRVTRTDGVTLIEMMLVLALVGVLATMGFALLNSKPRAMDVAAQLSAKIAEASRKAIAGGAVRADVLEALGSGVPRNQARTMVTINVGDGGGSIALARLEEDPLPASTASWVTSSVALVNQAVTISGFRTGATLTGGATSPETALAPGASLEVRCYPDGSCDGMVIYTAGHQGGRARVVVMPLGGSPLTLPGW